MPLAGEGFTVVGMGDFEEGLGAFFDGFAVELGDSVFGGDVVNVGAGGDYSCAWLEGGDDA